MSVWLIAALTGLGGLFLGVCSDMISEEMRGRLDRLPQALVRLAARRLPEEIRDDMAREWLAELHEVLHGAEAVPVTRLVKGVRYARIVLFSASGFAKEMGIKEEAAPEAPHEISLQERQARHIVQTDIEYTVHTRAPVVSEEIAAKIQDDLKNMRKMGWVYKYPVQGIQVEFGDWHKG